MPTKRSTFVDEKGVPRYSDNKHKVRTTNKKPSQNSLDLDEIIVNTLNPEQLRTIIKQFRKK